MKTINAEQRELFRRALVKTWQAVAPDVLRESDALVFTRPEVCEVALDMVEIHGGLSGDDLSIWRDVSPRLAWEIAKEAFPLGRYA